MSRNKPIWSSTQLRAASAANVPRSMPCSLGGGKPAGSALASPPPAAPPPRATKSPFVLTTNPNHTSPAPHPQNPPLESGSALYTSHSGRSRGYRRIAVTVVGAVCVCVWTVLCSPVEKSGEKNMSRRSMIGQILVQDFETAAVTKIFERRDTLIAPLLSTGEHKTLKTQIHTASTTVTAMWR